MAGHRAYQCQCRLRAFHAGGLPKSAGAKGIDYLGIWTAYMF